MDSIATTVRASRPRGSSASGPGVWARWPGLGQPGWAFAPLPTSKQQAAKSLKKVTPAKLKKWFRERWFE